MRNVYVEIISRRVCATFPGFQSVAILKRVLVGDQGFRAGFVLQHFLPCPDAERHFFDVCGSGVCDLVNRGRAVL